MYPRAVVLLEAEVERGELVIVAATPTAPAAGRAPAAARAAALELVASTSFAGPLGKRTEPTSGSSGEVRRRSSSVEPPPMSTTSVVASRASPTPRNVSPASSSPREQPRREAVAPLDLAEERLAVLRVADGARRDEQRPLGAERLGVAAVVGEHVSHARDRDGEEAAARVDALAEAVIRVSRCSSSTRPSSTSATRSRVVFVPEVDRRDDHLRGR